MQGRPPISICYSSLCFSSCALVVQEGELRSFTHSILAFSLLVSQAFTSNCKRSSIISIPAFPIPWAMRNPLLRRKSLLTATWLPSYVKRLRTLVQQSTKALGSEIA
ncbi:UNVERIFIED_CONTAM: hypothetical protein Slati_4555700 [Sesamum latifolium]|uniref:Secreted protein n=1 Tax=Sesamum latifolium TaxID=2727402 RepID=A0AAW2S242_9LAMI